MILELCTGHRLFDSWAQLRHLSNQEISEHVKAELPPSDSLDPWIAAILKGSLHP